jgi:Rieske Fe-S protein
MNEHDCTSCEAQTSSRRDFLREAAAAVAAISVALRMDPARAAATRLQYARGLEHDDNLRYAIPRTDGALIDKDHQVIVLRQGKRAYAFALSCPHQRTMLKWLPDQNRFQCPKHKSKYQPNGTFISGRATRGMDRLAIRLQGAELLVNKSVVFRQDKDPAGWAAAFVAIR